MKTDFDVLVNAFQALAPLPGDEYKIQITRGTNDVWAIRIDGGRIGFYFSKEGAFERISLPPDKRFTVQLLPPC